MKNKIVVFLLFMVFGSCEKPQECVECRDLYYFVWDLYPVKHEVYDTTYIRCAEEGHYAVEFYGYDLELPTDYVQDEVAALRDTTFLEGHFIRHRYCFYQ